MKRSGSGTFDSCVELKTSLGSQFLQYLAKVALSSRLAILEEKVRICQDQFNKEEMCTGCMLPWKTSDQSQVGTMADDFLRCDYCDQVLKCWRSNCEGHIHAHDCHVCQKPICENTEMEYRPWCRRCLRILCILNMLFVLGRESEFLLYFFFFAMASSESAISQRCVLIPCKTVSNSAD